MFNKIMQIISGGYSARKGHYCLKFYLTHIIQLHLYIGNIMCNFIALQYNSHSSFRLTHSESYF